MEFFFFFLDKEGIQGFAMKVDSLCIRSLRIVKDTGGVPEG